MNNNKLNLRFVILAQSVDFLYKNNKNDEKPHWPRVTIWCFKLLLGNQWRFSIGEP